MIPFFRKIRKQLAEENRPVQYLRYAVGEILLVVIGILIALQINSWAVEQDNLKLERSYLEALRFEISDNISFYTNIRDTLQSQNKAAIYLLHYLENSDVIIQDSLSFMNAFRSCAIGENLNRPEVTWQELQSTGRLSIIRNKSLVKKMFEYYTFIEQFASDFNKFPMDQRYAFRKFEHTLFNSTEHLEYFGSWRFETIPRREVFAKIRSGSQILDLTKSIMISSLVQSRIAQNALELSARLLEDIDREISK